MKQSKIFTAGLVALGIATAGAAIATAQDMVPAGPQDGSRAEMQAERAKFRGRDGGHHGRMGGHGGPGGREGFIELFEQVDSDGNGLVTQEEIDIYRSAKVGEADTSGDGALSIEEFDTIYREMTRSRMVDAFQRLDADGDGVVSEAEMDRRFGSIVERMDRNADGALSLEDRPRRR